MADRTLGAHLGAPLKRIRPNLDMDVWRLKRLAQRYRDQRGFADLDLRFDVNSDDIHLVVAPHFGPNAPTWHVAGQNIFFEVWKSAEEVLGKHRVTLFGVERDESPAQWHRRLLEMVADTRATHLIGQTENDPNQSHSWTWDSLTTFLARRWNGVFIGMMYDSAFPWLRMKARFLGRTFPKLLVADLCVPMSGEIRRGQLEVGPMTMPLSQETVRAIDAYVAGSPKTYQLTFIGALYDYRVQLIERLRAEGVNISVNPHRPDPTTNYTESRTNQPSYLDFMKGLAQSEMTLNFSLASGGPLEQYKIRVQEAALVGCLCLTDDVDRTRHFFAPNEYAYFPSLDSISSIVSERLSDIPRLRADQEAARVRAHELARTDFWGKIEQGLQLRGLPGLTGLTPPTGPRLTCP